MPSVTPAQVRQPSVSAAATPSGWFGRYRPLLAFALVAMLVSTLARVLLVLWQWPRVASTGALADIVLGGLRMDAVWVGLWTVFWVWLAALLPAGAVGHRIYQLVQRIWLASGLTLLVLLELATPTFIAEYDTRPNRLFIEYLSSPREVSAMLFKGYGLVVAVTLLGTALTAWVAWRWLLKPWQPARTPGSAHAPLRRVAFFLLGLALAMSTLVAARGTLRHRPANPSLVATTSDRMVNTLGVNSLYHVLFAAYTMRREEVSSEIYGELPEEAMLAEVRAHMQKPVEFIDPQRPTLHHQAATEAAQRPRHLVIVVQESMGAGFVGHLGGLGVTPRLDELSGQGWSFRRLHATGTRSVQGLEAITTGFLPSPSRAVLKLPRAQHGFFTLAELLRQQGYHTRFVYGGESHFDNMRGFFLGNGFEEVVDENDYPAPNFRGSWGVSDEDLFNKTHQLLMEDRQPTFSLVFTSSNHTPFEFPDGRIELHEQPKASVNNAVKYADHAMGEFFARAQRSPYWKDTVFLIIADHDARVAGASLVPVERFHIPGLILGGTIKPRQDDRLVSQIDMAPTLLSLLGVSAVHPMPGYDLTRATPDWPGRAVMQYDRNQAYWSGDRVVVLQPDKAPTTWRRENGILRPDEHDPALEQTALAHALFATWAYRNQAYGLPSSGRPGAQSVKP